VNLRCRPWRDKDVVRYLQVLPRAHHYHYANNPHTKIFVIYFGFIVVPCFGYNHRSPIHRSNCHTTIDSSPLVDPS
jgi:hypothetical protein